MGDVVNISGTLAAAPANGADGAFPSGVTTIPFAQVAGGSAGKPAAVSTGAQSRNVNSPSSFVTLSGVGAADTVQRADTLYLRTANLMTVRLTTTTNSGDTTTTVPVKGLCILEFDAGAYLSKVEVQGSGYVEWFASGQQ